MTSIPRLARSSKLAWVLVALAAAGCNQTAPYQRDVWLDRTAVPECDETLSIASDSNALLVTEPESLAELPLALVLTELLAIEGDVDTTPMRLLAQMFDQNNDTAGGVYPEEAHCDSPSNPAHVNGPAALCPRSEGALAKSTGFFTPGDRDHFFPVAVVNRFDLMPLAADTCGEYRIVYAKESGLTDPEDRVFLIFEMSIPNPHPGNLLGCRPVADFWQKVGAEADAKVRAEMLRGFFIDGLPGFARPLSNLGFGPGGGGAGYYGARGQVRVSQHMDEHWEMRELGLTRGQDGGLRFSQRTAGNNPMPHLFGVMPEGMEDTGQGWFVEDFAYSSVSSLSASRVEHMGMVISQPYLSGESALGGEAVNDYPARAAGNAKLINTIDIYISNNHLGEDCPTDDPLDADAIVRRATVQSCAGCHAPEQLLGPERKLGCGLTFPKSLGEVHIDEHGEISPALKEVFLPHRAEVLTTYLKACDAEAIAANVGGPFGTGAQTKSSSRRTLGGSTTH